MAREVRTMGGWAGAVEAYLAVDRSKEVHGTVDASSGELVRGPGRRGGGGGKVRWRRHSRRVGQGDRETCRHTPATNLLAR